MNHMIMKDMEEEQDWEETDFEEISKLFETVRKLKKSEITERFKERYGYLKPKEKEMRASEEEKGLQCSKCMFQVAIKNKNQNKKQW